MVTCHSETVGMKCEEHVIHICESLGYYVWRPPHGNPNWDILVNNKRVEIKSRSSRPGNKTSIELSTAKRQTNVVCTLKDVDFFVVFYDQRWFVFPSSAIANLRGDIPNRIRVADIAGYRDAWRVLEGDSVCCERQMGFDF